MPQQTHPHVRGCFPRNKRLYTETQVSGLDSEVENYELWDEKQKDQVDLSV